MFLLRGFKPLSINATYVRTFNGVRKSADATDWFRSLFYALSGTENQRKLAELRAYFDPRIHYYKFDLTTVYEPSDFFTKQGLASSKTQDLSNTEKSIIDAFCLPKFHIDVVPDGCPNLNMDDKHVWELTSRKAPGPQRGIIVHIEARPQVEWAPVHFSEPPQG